MPEESYISLSELQRRIKGAVEMSLPVPLWVAAEIAEIKVNHSGHCYLELVEKAEPAAACRGDAGAVPKAQARAVIWRSQYAMLSSYFEAETGCRLEAGMRVLAKVLVSYHELYGLTLQVTDLDASYTLGEVERQRQPPLQHRAQHPFRLLSQQGHMPFRGFPRQYKLAHRGYAVLMHPFPKPGRPLLQQSRVKRVGPLRPAAAVPVRRKGKAILCDHLIQPLLVLLTFAGYTAAPVFLSAVPSVPAIPCFQLRIQIFFLLLLLHRGFISRLPLHVPQHRQRAVHRPVVIQCHVIVI